MLTHYQRLAQRLDALIREAEADHQKLLRGRMTAEQITARSDLRGVELANISAWLRGASLEPGTVVKGDEK